MLKLTSEQLRFIQKQYYILSGDCAKYFNSDEFEKLEKARIRLSEFIYTIENLFNCDFYKEILINF